MSSFDAAVARWQSVSPEFLRKIAALSEFRRWQPAICGADAFSLRFRGPRYELTIAPRAVHLRTDGRLVVQTAVVCDNLLARALSVQLRLAECWPEGSHYRIGTFRGYLDWMAGNTAEPPQFSPSLWSSGAPEEEITAWLRKLRWAKSLIETVERGEPAFALLDGLIEKDKRIPGSPPTWGGAFDRAVASLDLYGVSQVIAEASAVIAAAKVPNEAACELKRLVRWLSVGALPDKA